MWKIQKESNLLTRLVVTLVFIAQFSRILALSDKRLCADEECKDIISLGTGKINYRAGEEGMVSFKINAPIRIKSKSAGKDPTLWGVEVSGREGYAPKQFIRETKIIISEKTLKFEVDVVKPGSTVPVLNTSENVVVQGDTAAVEISTTTKPLDMIPVESKEEPIVKNPVENASTEKPAVATPVLMEMVDGTQIPVMDDGVKEDLIDVEKDSSVVTQSAGEDDDEIGDYDDDEDDVDLENEVEEEAQSKIEPRAFSSMESTEIKSNETLDSTQGINGNDIDFDKTKEPAKSNDLPSPEVDINSEYTEKNVSENSITSLGSTQGINGNDIDFDKTKELAKSNDLHLADSIKSEEVNINSEYTEKSASENSMPSQILNEFNKPSNVGEIKTSVNLQLSEVFNDKPFEILNEDFKANDNGETKTSENLPSSEVLNDATQPFEILNEVDKPSDSGEITTSENFPSSEVHNKATQPSEMEINMDEKLSSSLEGEPQIESQEDSELDQKITENHVETQDSTPTRTEQQINDNPKDSTEVLETEQHISTENINTLDENNSTKEALNTANDKGSIENENISNIESLPDKKTGEELKLENSLSLDYKDEKFVSDSSQEQYFNTEMHTQQIETQKYEKTIETENLQTNKESAFFTKPTTQTESPNAKQLTTESATIPQNTIENQQEETIESTLNTLTPTQTEIATNAETNKESSPTSHSYNDPYQQTSTESSLSSPSPVLNNDPYQQQTDYVHPTPYNPYDDAPSNTPLPPKYDYTNQDSSSSSSQHTTEIPQYDYDDQQPTGYAPSDYIENEVVTENPKDQSSVGYGSIEPLQPMVTPEPPKDVEEEPKALPSLTPPTNEDIETKENRGLFATIMGTVNNMLSINKKAKHDEHGEKDELHRILFPNRDHGQTIKNQNTADNIQYCEKLGPNGDCSHLEIKQKQTTAEDCDCNDANKSIFTADLTFDTFIHALASKILEISELLAFLAIVAAASLFFIFGYYCFCNSSREGALLSKLNQLESSLLATHKENAILKHNLMSTRQKLASIEDNSFGSNDMVLSLKKELEEELLEKARLQEQITNLQKELENAADAGIELNKIVSELLSNQTGDESIISSVEELQKQLNEQQNTILEINASLAEKSRENSELQLLIAEQNARYESEIDNLQRDNDELEQEKGNLQTRLEEIRSDFDKDITAALEGKNFEIKRLQNEIVELSNKIENEHTKWQTSMAKVEALEECLKNVKRDPNVNITQVIDVANIRAELIDAQKKYTTLKERLEIELDSRKLAENQLQIVSAEVEKLKQDFNQSEKDKLEAQTRLEVLSNYFKEKENQLQKELSLKEAMWLKQQGETTTTVDRLTAMQEEIQSLKSQNDSLRAEIEAQVAAHKAQTGTLENRAHETWLAARQSDRRYEEARAEATALRRKLTALAGGGNVNEANKPPAGSAGLGDELTNAPSPIHMESPGSPMLGRMPLPPFLPPPFMGPPPPFMGMPPPPPFVPPGEMRPAPLGRIMSPPPPQRSGRFSPQHLDYEDYLDYEGGNNTWHRHTYSPPRTHRSLSPTDSRYNYGTERDLMSTYDTETDFSPPPSPRESRRRGGGGGNGSERGSNNTRSPYNNSKKSNSGNKGHLSSGSDKSYNSSSHHGSKTKGGNSGGGKSLV